MMMSADQDFARGMENGADWIGSASDGGEEVCNDGDDDEDSVDEDYNDNDVNRPRLLLVEFNNGADWGRFSI